MKFEIRDKMRDKIGDPLKDNVSQLLKIASVAENDSDSLANKIK
jgi:hypothetical protein